MRLFNLTLIIITFFWSGCTDAPSFPEKDDLLFINAVLDPDRLNQEIYVHWAINTDKFEEYIKDSIETYVSGAIVKVSDGSNEVYFTEVMPGQYVDLESKLKIEAECTYTLTVTAPNGVVISAQTTVPANKHLAAPIDSLVVDMITDTTQEIYERITTNPVTFKWENEAGEAYLFLIHNQDYDTSEFPVFPGVFDTVISRYTYVRGPEIMEGSSITLFDTTDYWYYYTSVETDTSWNCFIQIISVNRNINEYYRYKYFDYDQISNIKNGIGCFGAIQRNYSRLKLIFRHKYI